MTYYLRKTDANQALIVDQLRQLGFSVALCHRAGGGFPDLAVGRRGITLLVEVKSPRTRFPNAKQGYKMLTPDEQEFFETYTGAAIVAVTVDDIVKWFDNIEGLT